MDFGPVPNVGADGVGYQLFQAMAQYLNQQAPDRPAPDRPAPDRTAHDRTETEHQCCLPRRLKIFLIILLSLGIPAAIGGIFSTMHPAHGDSVTKVLNGTEQVTYVAWDGVMMSALSNFCLLIVTAVLVIYWLFLIGFIATLFNDMKTANTTQTQWKRIRRAKTFWTCIAILLAVGSWWMAACSTNVIVWRKTHVPFHVWTEPVELPQISASKSQSKNQGLTPVEWQRLLQEADHF